MNFIKNSWKSLFKKQQSSEQKQQQVSKQGTQQKSEHKAQQQQIPYEILEQLFKLSSELIKQSKNVNDSNVKLKIYGLYKQATIGDNNTNSPQIFDFIGKSKWSSWQALKGMKKTQAMMQYIKTVSDADPNISKKIGQKLSQGEPAQAEHENKQEKKQTKPTQGVGYKKVQAVDHSDSYSHPYFKPIQKGEDIPTIQHDKLLQKNNEPQVYPLHFAIDRQRVDLVKKFLQLLTISEIESMKDAQGTGILQYAQLIQNEQILQLVEQKLKQK